ncbi:unnamed protein product [Parajaminaea phylloscopi]
MTNNSSSFETFNTTPRNRQQPPRGPYGMRFASTLFPRSSSSPASLRQRLTLSVIRTIRGWISTSFNSSISLAIPPCFHPLTEHTSGQSAASPHQSKSSTYRLRLRGATRKASLLIRRMLIKVGRDIAGESDGPPYPSGILGWLTAAVQSAFLQRESEPWARACNTERDRVRQLHEAASGPGLRSSDAFAALYTDGDFGDFNDGGPSPGILANGGTDECFGFERLSSQPFSLRRLDAKHDAVPFEVPDDVVMDLSSTFVNTHDLLRAGRLFYIDYRFLTHLKLAPHRFTAATDALFFMDERREDDLMPLAIRTHRIPSANEDDAVRETVAAIRSLLPIGDGSLIYHPRDSSAAWSLAKLIFAQNDLWVAQTYHLTCTHHVLDALSLHAMRCFSRHHPVFALLKLITKDSFGTRSAFLSRVFAAGGTLDNCFPFVDGSARDFSAALWRLGEDNDSDAPAFPFPPGRSWAKTTFRSDLQRRGLIPRLYKNADERKRARAVSVHDPPAFRRLPYFDDTRPLYDGMRRVIESFLRSFYTQDATVSRDVEVARWVIECSATLSDFPAEVDAIADLAELLSHAAFLSGIKHNILSGASPSHVTAVLPWHPASFYRRLPSTPHEKAAMRPIHPGSEPGPPIDQLWSFLPQLDAACGQIALFCTLNRPSYQEEQSFLPFLLAPLTACSFERHCADTVDIELGPIDDRRGDFLEAEKAFRKAMTELGDSFEVRRRAWPAPQAWAVQQAPFAFMALNPLSLPTSASI